MFLEADFYGPQHPGSFASGFCLASANLEALANDHRKEIERGQDIYFTFPHSPSCLFVAFGSSFIPLPRAMVLVIQPCLMVTGLGKFQKLLPFVPSGLGMAMVSSCCESLETLSRIGSPKACPHLCKESLHQTLFNLPFECAICFLPGPTVLHIENVFNLCQSRILFLLITTLKFVKIQIS